MYKRKYKQGRKIASFEAMLSALRKVKFVYINDKILHDGWISSLQFRYLVYAMGRGQIKRAIKIKGE